MNLKLKNVLNRALTRYGADKNLLFVGGDLGFDINIWTNSTHKFFAAAQIPVRLPNVYEIEPHEIYSGHINFHGVVCTDPVQHSNNLKRLHDELGLKVLCIFPSALNLHKEQGFRLISFLKELDFLTTQESNLSILPISNKCFTHTDNIIWQDKLNEIFS